MILLRPCCSLFLAASLSASTAFAQDEAPVDLTALDLEELMKIEVQEVYGASRHVERTMDAPSSVSIVTAEEIRARHYRTLDEVLRGVCGVYANYDRNYRHVGVRGFYLPGDYNSRILLLVDGHRLNENVYGSANLGYESPIDVDLIEHVEFIRGPGSALYGSNAFFGVVNVVTKRGGKIGGVELVGEAASHDTYLARATYGGVTASGVDYVASVRGVQRAGSALSYDDFASTPSGGSTRGTDYERAYQAFTSLDFGDVDVESAYSWREKGIPTGSFGAVFDDPDNRTVDAQGYLDVAWRKELGADRELTARAHYDDYYYHGWYVYDDTASGGPPDLVNNDKGRGRWLGAEAQLALGAGDAQRWTVGTDVRWNIAQDQSNYDETATYLDDQRDSVEWGLFAQDEIAVSPGIDVVAGARFDHYDTFGGALSPRLGVIGHPTEDSALKLLFGTAFRAPNAYELYYGDSGTQKPNPDLDPEQVRTYEAVWERFFGARARASVSLFHYDVADLIVQHVDPGDGLLVFDNSDDVVANGIELEGATMLTDDLRLTVSQVFQRVEDDATGDRLVNSPSYVTQAHVETPLFDQRLFAAVEVIAVGSRETVAGETADGYVLTNLNLRAPRLADGIELSLGFFNLFDVAYSDPVGAEIVQDTILQDGLTVALRLTVRR